MSKQLLERFYDKVLFTTDCWEWVGGKSHGYGYFSIGKKLVRAHRFLYELYKGKIPIGLDLDHLCRNRKCVNPEHLEPVTRRENMNRGDSANRNKTHCKKGHEFTLENTIIDRKKRYCKECQRTHSKNQWLKIKENKK